VTGKINTLVQRKHKQILFVMYSQPSCYIMAYKSSDDERSKAVVAINPHKQTFR